jgi:hypothetical protein
MRNLMPHTPATYASARNATLRPAVGGRRAPVTARGRAVLDETLRRLHNTGLQPEYSRPGRSAR